MSASKPSSGGKPDCKWLARAKDAAEALAALVSMVGTVVAIFIARDALRISSEALRVTREGLEVRVSVNGEALGDPDTQLLDLPASMVPNSACALTFPFEVEIDNRSLRRVSIRDVSGTLLLDGASVANLRVGGRGTGFYGDLERLTDTGPVPLRLPYALEDGESVDITTPLGWPLEKAACEAIPRIAKQAWLYGPLRLSLVKAILASEGVTLGRGQVEYMYGEGSAAPLSGFPQPHYLTPSRLVLLIEVTTSLDTQHLARIDLK